MAPLFHFCFTRIERVTLLKLLPTLGARFTSAKEKNMITLIALIITIVGALNWLLIGICGFNLVSWLTMNSEIAQRIVYILVGIAGAWLVYFIIRRKGRVDESFPRQDRQEVKE